MKVQNPAEKRRRSDITGGNRSAFGGTTNKRPNRLQSSGRTLRAAVQLQPICPTAKDLPEDSGAPCTGHSDTRWSCPEDFRVALTSAGDDVLPVRRGNALFGHSSPLSNHPNAAIFHQQTGFGRGSDGAARGLAVFSSFIADPLLVRFSYVGCA